MYSQSESAVLESVEANVVIDSDKLVQVNEHQTENNGPCVDEIPMDDGVKDIGAKNSDQPVISSPSAVNVPDAFLTPPAKAKGFGLKKWRRIKREVNKDGNYSSDTGKMLRRGSSALAHTSNKPRGLSSEISFKSDGSLSSTNAEMRNVGFNSGFAFDSGSAIGPSFAAETDSDNSEDHSSKSSTAASIPKLSRKTASWMGYQPDRNRVKNQTGISVVDPFQRDQQGKSQKETSKKARGEQIKIEKENSRSSMESDSRSSNVLFIHGSNSMTSNGRLNRKSTNYDEAIIDEILDGEHKMDGELQDDYDKDIGKSEDTLQDDLTADFTWTAKGKAENCISSTAHDPLVESILALQSAQEMLEKELVELKEVKISLLNELTQNSSLHSELMMPEKSFHSQVISLRKELSKLKDKLGESTALLKQKEDKVVELEEALKLNSSTINEMQDILKVHPKRESDMEVQIECFLKEKIETEIQFIVLSRALQKFDNELALNEDKVKLMHEGEVEEVKTYSTKLVESEEVLKLENKSYQVGLYFLIQLVLFFVVFVLCFARLSNYYSGIVPT